MNQRIKKIENAALMYYNIAMVTTDQAVLLLPMDIRSFHKIRKKDDYLLNLKKGAGHETI